MCGIFGQVGEPLSPGALAAVRAVLRHRGPDSDATRVLDGAALVHTRLRIIDLSAAAAQPMPNEDESVWVTFNGEIYNFVELREELVGAGHRFRSRADTEVLVHGYEEWGDGLCERLDGMFAFGLWDARRRRLLLARDRAGKKPLFHAERPGALAFGSEIKALAAAGWRTEPDPAGVAAFLAYGYVPAPGTVYRAIHELPPASRLVLEHGQPARVERYWTVDFRARPEPVGEDEAASRVRQLVVAAVKKRLVADVPVGAFLSGGLDSTIVVGVMSRLGHRVRSFSIGFAGDARYDETGYARMAARAFGTEHHEFLVEPGDFALVEKLVWHHDGPFGDSSAIPSTVVAQKTREHVTVALSGDGGDELFAGYLRFWAAGLAERVPVPLRRLGERVAAALPAGLAERSTAGRVRRFLRAAALPLGDRLVAWNAPFPFELAGLLQPEVLAAAPPERVLAFHRRFFGAQGAPGASPLAQALAHNFGGYLPGDLLVKVDRTTMAHALEARSPLLDTALVEYVAGLPDDLKLRGRVSKFILRRAFADLVPPEIARRGKMGFGIPLGTWFRGALREYLRDHLGAPGARLTSYVRPAAVQALVEDHASGRADHSHRLWSLLTLEIWLRNLSRLAEPWPAVQGVACAG